MALLKFIIPILVLVSFQSKAQFYTLLDKTMVHPVKLVNTVTVIDEYQNMFPVETKFIPVFVEKLKHISSILRQKNLPEVLNISIGKTSFNGIRTKNSYGERMDIVISTVCANREHKMHLCSSNIKTENNIYFINAWTDYIKSFVR